MAFLKQDDLQNAVKYLNKSLTEHRDPAILKRVSEIEREIKMKEARAYEDPVKAEEAKQRGNQLFSSGKYPDVRLLHYHLFTTFSLICDNAHFRP